MTKLMSKREMALYKVAMNAIHAYDEATNDPRCIEEVAQAVADRTGFDWDFDDICECCEQIMGS